jgi:hypothetical protein
LVCRALAKECYSFDEQLIEAMGWADEMHAALSDEDADGEPKTADYADEDAFVLAKLATCDSDQLARFAVLLALLSGPARFDAEGRAELRSIAEHYEVDVAAIAAEKTSGEDESYAAETDHPLLPAARAADGGDADAENIAAADDQPAAPAPTEQAAPAAKKPSRAKAKKVAPAAPEQIDDAGSAGEQATASASKSKTRSAKTATPPASEQKDKAGSAGLERDPRVQDMFEGASA